MNLKLLHIIESWKNMITRPEEFQDTAKERAAICAECQCNIVNFCSQCGCLISAKTWTPAEECPIGLWDSVLDDEQ